MSPIGRGLPARFASGLLVGVLVAFHGGGPLAGRILAQDAPTKTQEVAAGSTGKPRKSDPAPDASTPAPDRPIRGLIAITRREAEREQVAAREAVAKLIAELGASADTSLNYVSRRLEQLVRLGPAALPILIRTIEQPVANDADRNRGLGAARALAMIASRGHAARVMPRLIELAESSSAPVRAFACRALGWSGLDGALQPLIERIADPEPVVVEAAARAVGDLGRQEAAPSLASLLASAPPAISTAAVESLARLNAPGYEETLANKLDSLRDRDDVTQTVLHYLATHGNADCVTMIGRVVADSVRNTGLRLEAAATLRDIARARGGRSRLKVLDILWPLIGDNTLSNFVVGVAHILDDLEDERGLEKVVAPETRVLKQNPRHYYSRQARAKKYYDFHRYTEAIADCREALRWGRREKSTDDVRVLMAACYAGVENFKTARRVLRETALNDLRQLPKIYPEFETMARDKHYASLFGQ